MSDEHETPYTDKLKDYREQKKQGVDYIECPRCDGTLYETAVPYDQIDSYHPQTEEYPCPLCVTVTDIDIDKAIEWLKEKAEYEENYEEEV
jgi:hypothetical protein